MKNSLTFFVVTPAVFAAAFLTVWLWPANSPGERKAKTIPQAAAKRARSKGSWLTRRLEEMRARSLTPAEARAIMERVVPPVPVDEFGWLTEVLQSWTDSEPDAALDWLSRLAARAGDVEPVWNDIVLAPLARKDLPGAVAILHKLTGGRGSYDAILAAAAERDPAGAMAFVAQHPAMAKDGAKAFRLWLECDASSACAWFSSVARPDIFADAIGDMVKDLAALAPDRLPAVLAALAQKDVSASELALQKVAALEVDRDPAAALARFSSLSEAEQRRMLEPLAFHLAARGTGAEIAAVLQHLNDQHRFKFLNSLSARFYQTNMDGLLALVRLPDLATDDKNHLLIQRATELKPAQVEEFIDLLYSRHTWQNSDLWVGNLQSNPEETLPVLNRMIAAGNVDDSVLLTITGRLIHAGQGDVEKIIAALPENQRAGPQAIFAIKAALSGDSGDLTAWQNLPDSAARREVLKEALRTSNDEWGQPDFEPAAPAAFLRRLPPARQVEVLTEIALTPSQIVEFLPAVTQAARAAGNSNDPVLVETVDRLASSLSDDAPAATMQWLDTLPPGEAQEAGYDEAFLDLARADSATAAAWLAARPANAPHRDDMAGLLASELVESDPETAWQWAASIQDESGRRYAQKEVLSRWRTLDPAAAKAAGEPQP